MHAWVWKKSQLCLNHEPLNNNKHTRTRVFQISMYIPPHMLNNTPWYTVYECMSSYRWTHVDWFHFISPEAFDKRHWVQLYRAISCFYSDVLSLKSNATPHGRYISDRVTPACHAASAVTCSRETQLISRGFLRGPQGRIRAERPWQFLTTAISSVPLQDVSRHLS